MNFTLGLFLIPGPIILFTVIALVVWLVVKYLSWLSQFEIKKVFIIVTNPFVLVGMVFLLIAA
ncbi:MAG TPA: hypothetical protein VFY26_03970 [Anaerolineales bacterium]|nr:hypothetical protein [Anaerolineales bacterium]